MPPAAGLRLSVCPVAFPGSQSLQLLASGQMDRGCCRQLCADAHACMHTQVSPGPTARQRCSRPHSCPMGTDSTPCSQATSRTRWLVHVYPCGWSSTLAHLHGSSCVHQRHVCPLSLCLYRQACGGLVTPGSSVGADRAGCYLGSPCFQHLSVLF